MENTLKKFKSDREREVEKKHQKIHRGEEDYKMRRINHCQPFAKALVSILLFCLSSRSTIIFRIVDFFSILLL